MRVSRQTHDDHRLAILHAAGTLFRKNGFDGVSVADVTRAAGLTHGAFYGHYASKTVLAAAACADSLSKGAASWRARAQQARDAGHEGLGAIIESYLNARHRDAPERGCVLAALGTEMSRGDEPLRAALADGTAALAEVIAEEIALLRPAVSPEMCGRLALGVLAAMTGGLLLARAFSDPTESEQALKSAIRAARAAAEA
jgi:TetR/AcrR family transcriptional repressor of nem operon